MKIGSNVYYCDIEEYGKELLIVKVIRKINAKKFKVAKVKDKEETKLQWDCSVDILFKTAAAVRKHLNEKQEKEHYNLRFAFDHETGATTSYYKDINKELKELGRL